MKKKIYQYIFLLSWLFIESTSFISCSLDIPPMDMFSDPDAISNVTNARSFLASAYISYPNYQLEFSVLGNDFCPTSITYKDIAKNNLYNWREKEIRELAPNVWLSYYHVISLCDALEERLPMVKVEKESEKDDLENIRHEEKVLKAMSYLQLLKLFAPAYDTNPQAPGIVLKNYLGIENKQRASMSECAVYIEHLLIDAISTPYQAKSKAWLSKDAATYLLADLYLYMGQYDKAAKYAQKLLDKMPIFTSSYKQTYNALWTEVNASERIFAFYINAPVYAQIESDKTEGDFFALNPTLVYNPDDERFDAAIYPFTINQHTQLLLGKYNKVEKDGKLSPYLNVMRRSGIVFIAAEAYARLNQKDKALALLNDYRKLTGNKTLSNQLSNDVLIDSVLADKYKEFAGEGINFFDLKRTHRQPLYRLSVGGKSVSFTISVNDYRWTWPIPKSEYRFNEQVSQNKGWYMVKRD